MTLVNYTLIKIQENNNPLVDLAKYPFVIEPKYHAWGLSDDPQLLVRKEIAEKLLKIQSKLSGVKFKIWDAYRSREVQGNIYSKFWNELKAQHPNWTEEQLRLETGKFVSPTQVEGRIPPHVTGGAIDLALVDEGGTDLVMGTEFDFFGPEASPFYYEIHRNNEIARSNREKLRNAMLSEDFTLDADEWWHFDYGNQIWAFKSGKDTAIYGEL